MTYFFVVFVMLFSGLSQAGGVESKYAPTSVEMTLEQVSEHVYYAGGKPGVATDNEGFISNAGVIITDKEIILVDALGTPSLGYKLLQLIREISDKPITKVIVTHYHADHIYGLQVFEGLGAEIIAPAAAYEYIRSPQAAERLEERQFSLEPWVNESTYVVEPDRALTKSLNIQSGDVSITVSLLGSAHSEGDLTVYVEPDRVLLSGDIIFEGRVPFLGDAETKGWLDVLARMKTNRLEALIPGHGDAAGDANRAVTFTHRYLSYMREKMFEAVDSFTPFADVYDEIDWSEFESMPAFDVANRRNAYQVYLSLEAELLSAE